MRMSESANAAGNVRSRRKLTLHPGASVGQPTRNLVRCHHRRQVGLLLAFEALLDDRSCR
jgi:hypothetical protein